MSLTCELLRELDVNEPAIQRILQAHQEAVEALENTAAARAREYETLRSEYEDFRREIEAQRTAREREGVIRDALFLAGANEKAIPLLATAVCTTDADWEGASLRDAAAVLAPVREQYAAFFAQPIPLPTATVSPPLESSTLTLEDVRRMSPGEINDNWSLIRATLAQGS